MKSLLVVLLLTAATAQGEIYTWKDPRGTAHFTNNMNEIPVRYRTRIKVLNYETEQKKDPSASPRIGGTQPVAQPDHPAASVAAGSLIQPNVSIQSKIDKPESVQRKSYPRKSEKKIGKRNAANRPDE
jgi:hypothetical protein